MTRPAQDDEPLAGLDVVAAAAPEANDMAGLSADQRRTRRQAADVAAGRHPLTGGPLHRDASTDRDRTSGSRDPFTCGTCVHRVDMGWPKCNALGPSAMTHSAATDVRAWWPACPIYIRVPSIEDLDDLVDLAPDPADDQEPTR